MWADTHSRRTNKLVLYGLFLMMLFIGGIGPLIETLDDDENLGITFLETRIVGHDTDVARIAHFAPIAPAVLACCFSLDIPIKSVCEVLKSHYSATIVIAILSFPLRT